MNRRTAAAVAAAPLLSCLAIGAPAVAADHPGAPSALGTHLKYHVTSWTEGDTAMSMAAPRGWSFAVTPEDQARFNDRARTDVLTMSYRGEGPLRPQLQRKVASLRGTPGLHVLVVRGHGRGDSAYGELRYRWTPQGGGARFVDYRYQGDDIYEVAGRLVDRRGLEAVLDSGATTGDCD